MLFSLKRKLFAASPNRWPKTKLSILSSNLRATRPNARSARATNADVSLPGLLFDCFSFAYQTSDLTDILVAGVAISQRELEAKAVVFLVRSDPEPNDGVTFA